MQPCMQKKTHHAAQWRRMKSRDNKFHLLVWTNVHTLKWTEIFILYVVHVWLSKEYKKTVKWAMIVKMSVQYLLQALSF